MKYIDLRELSSGELKQVRRQVVRLKEMGKTGKEIEEITGVRQNRASEIWTAYQREGEAALEGNKGGRAKGEGRILLPKEEAEIRETIVNRQPNEFGLSGQLRTLKKVCELCKENVREKDVRRVRIRLYETLGPELPASSEVYPEAGCCASAAMERGRISGHSAAGTGRKRNVTVQVLFKHFLCKTSDYPSNCRIFKPRLFDVHHFIQNMV